MRQWAAMSRSAAITSSSAATGLSVTEVTLTVSKTSDSSHLSVMWMLTDLSVSDVDVNWLVGDDLTGALHVL